MNSKANDNKYPIAGTNGSKHIPIKFDEAIAVEEPLLNSYGLDLTNPDYIKYSHGNVEIEVIGGVHDLVLTQLKVTLKLRKKDSTSSLQVFRSQQVDLFNEYQLDHLIKSASERIKVESIKVKEAIYDLTDRLESYRQDKQYMATQPEVSSRISTQSAKQVKAFLKRDDLLDRLKTTLEGAGVPDTQLGLKLFLLGLSRITNSPIHTIVQGDLMLANEVFKTLIPTMPEEHLIEATSISKTALSYPPYQDYWQNKTLVLHGLDASLGKGSLIEEYINSGQLKRIVTEDNHKIGVRKSGEKNNEDVFGIMGYTNKDFLPIFNAPNVVCLPMMNIKAIKERLYDLEIRKYAGLIDEQQRLECIQLLVNIQRSIRPLKVVNPYFDQVDFEPFFKSDIKQIRLFLQLTNLMALLHQEQLGKKKIDGQVCIEVTPQHMVAVLKLFKEVWLTKDEELYFRVIGTLDKLKTALKKEFQPEYKNNPFKAKDYRQKVGIAPSTYNRHIKQLDSYGKLVRVGGNNRNGYEYKIASWDEQNNNAVLFDQLIKELNEIE